MFHSTFLQKLCCSKLSYPLPRFISLFLPWCVCFSNVRNRTGKVCKKQWANIGAVFVAVSDTFGINNRQTSPIWTFTLFLRQKRKAVPMSDPPTSDVHHIFLWFLYGFSSAIQNVCRQWSFENWLFPATQMHTREQLSSGSNLIETGLC